jgi:hypothetical protein
MGILSKEALVLIKTEDIVFDLKELRIRESVYDDTKTHKICRNNTVEKGKKKYPTGCANFGFKTDIENIEGKYLLEQEGDWFYLNKQEELTPVKTTTA